MTPSQLTLITFSQSHRYWLNEKDTMHLIGISLKENIKGLPIETRNGRIRIKCTCNSGNCYIHSPAL